MADEKQELDSGLFEALVVAKNPNAAQRSKRQLMTWCQSVAAVNQRSFVALVRFCHMLKPAANTVNSQVIVEVAKMTARLGFTEVYAKDAVVPTKN